MRTSPTTPRSPSPAARPVTRQQATLAALAALVSLALAALACTANDTLFIRLTETPTPTITPTPLPDDTRFRPGDTAVVVGVSAFAGINLPAIPGPFRPGIPDAATCFPGARVPILDVARNLDDPNDETIYYQVQCSGTGWAAESNLSRFAQYDAAVIESPDGQGAPMYRGPDVNGAQFPARCPDGSAVMVLLQMVNPMRPTDPNIYVQVTCEGQTGYVIEDMLEPPAS